MAELLLIDDDLRALAQRVAEREGLTVEQVLREALHAGLQRAASGSRQSASDVPVYSMGVPRVNLDKSLTLADEIDNEAEAIDIDDPK